MTLTRLIRVIDVPKCHIIGFAGVKDGGSTLGLIFRNNWFITVRFHSIHLRAYFLQVNVTIALVVFYLQLSYQF